MSTPLTLAITGSAAGVCAKAKPPEARSIMTPVAAANRGRRDAGTDRSMTRRRGSGNIGNILRVGCATQRSAEKRRTLAQSAAIGNRSNFARAREGPDCGTHRLTRVLPPPISPLFAGPAPGAFLSALHLARKVPHSECVGCHFRPCDDGPAARSAAPQWTRKELRHVRRRRPQDFWFFE